MSRLETPEVCPNKYINFIYNKYHMENYWAKWSYSTKGVGDDWLTTFKKLKCLKSPIKKWVSTMRKTDKFEHRISKHLKMKTTRLPGKRLWYEEVPAKGFLGSPLGRVTCCPEGTVRGGRGRGSSIVISRLRWSIPCGALEPSGDRSHVEPWSPQVIDPMGYWAWIFSPHHRSVAAGCLLGWGGSLRLSTRSIRDSVRSHQQQIFPAVGVCGAQAYRPSKGDLGGAPQDPPQP